jgi:hypothetical protein
MPGSTCVLEGHQGVKRVRIGLQLCLSLQHDQGLAVVGVEHDADGAHTRVQRGANHAPQRAAGTCACIPYCACLCSMLVAAKMQQDPPPTCDCLMLCHKSCVVCCVMVSYMVQLSFGECCYTCKAAHCLFMMNMFQCSPWADTKASQLEGWCPCFFLAVEAHGLCHRGPQAAAADPARPAVGQCSRDVSTLGWTAHSCTAVWRGMAPGSVVVLVSVCRRRVLVSTCIRHCICTCDTGCARLVCLEV